MQRSFIERLYVSHDHCQALPRLPIWYKKDASHPERMKREIWPSYEMHTSTDLSFPRWSRTHSSLGRWHQDITCCGLPALAKYLQ